MIDAAIRFGDGDIIAFVREGCFGIHSKEHGTLFTEPLGIAGAKIECLASMTELAKGELEPDIEELNDDFEYREWGE